MAGPLEGIRVLDLTRVLAGPYATMVLADLGAEVIKVERPEGGDMARGSGPFIDGESSYFLSLNRGKKSVVLDLKTDRGKDILLRLVEGCDVLVENFVPGVMERLGLEYDVVKEHNSRIVYASVSGFGQTGPYAHRPALDVIVQGMGGIMSITGEPEGPPIRPGSSFGDIAAGLYAAVGILAALQERERSGEGQYLDISMLDCQLAVLENAFARYFATGEIPGPLGTRHPVTTPFQAFETKDGYITLAFVGGAKDQWPLFCALIDRVDLIDDERFQTSWSRTQNYGELIPILTEAMKKKSSGEWLKELDEAGIPCGPINNIEQVVQDPQVAAREMITGVFHPRLGPLKVVNTPVKLSRTLPKVEGAAPGLGEHTTEVLKELAGLEEGEIRQLWEGWGKLKDAPN
ncbi:MAG: CaiB/BaiF CoA transferase family protein [Dehalococcoidia bacterium]